MTDKSFSLSLTFLQNGPKTAPPPGPRTWTTLYPGKPGVYPAGRSTQCGGEKNRCFRGACAAKTPVTPILGWKGMKF